MTINEITVNRKSNRKIHRTVVSFLVAVEKTKAIHPKDIDINR